MDIIEQLRKHQCPENKGCNPLVEYCQCALMDSGADEIERLRELLQNWMGCCFVDEKNGSVSFGMGVKKVWSETRSALQQKDSE